MYWVDLCNEMDKYVVGEIDACVWDNEEISDNRKLGIHKIIASGSFYSEWDGKEWHTPPTVEKEIRKQWDRKYKQKCPCGFTPDSIIKLPCPRCGREYIDGKWK